MQTIRVINYKHLLKEMFIGRKYSIVQFSSSTCKKSKMLARKIEERATLDIDVYDVEYKKNKVTAKMFDVHSIPTVIFFEDSIPISRITGSEEVDDFLDVVEIIVVNGVQIID